MTRSVTRLCALLSIVTIAACDSTPPRVATTISVAPGAPTTGIVGSSIMPGALVLDQDGQPLGGVTVTFAVTGGGGSIPGAKESTTDDNGVATVSGWLLGTTTGSNTMTAKVGELPTVTFTVDAAAGSAASVQKVTGDNVFAGVGTAVSEVPVVRISDAHGNRVPNAAVTFAVATGGGSITGGTATTDANGEAALGSWTLGSANGTNTITASVAGLAPVTFTATAVTKCTVAGGTALTVGGSANGGIQTTDCAPIVTQPRYGDVYTFTLASQTSLAITMSSGAVHPYLAITNAAGDFIAESLDSEPGLTTVTMRMMLPAGTYAIMATTAVAVELGAYTLSLATAGESLSQCGFTWTTRGITTNQTVTLSDCYLEDGNLNRYYGDIFALFLPAGAVLTADMTSGAFDTWIDLFSAQGSNVASNDDISPTNTNSRLVYTVPVANYYLVFPNTALSGQTGAYQFAIAPASGPAALMGSAQSIERPAARRSVKAMGRPIFLGRRLSSQ